MSRVGITVEGGLLAADLVERIAAGDDVVMGQQAKDFDIEATRLSAEIQAAFSDIRVFWDAFKRRREHAQTSAVTLTREGWVIPFLERLGYSLRFQRAGILIGGQNYLLSHRVGDGETATPVHIVAWNQQLGQRGDDKRSPHALLQEYLNRGDALWGIVTNGRELRLLRNSARSSRPSYVAVDLETILDGNLYNEFVVVYRLLHRTRLHDDGGDPHDCLLETWYQQSIDEGGRVRDGLRVGVKAALETLGSGFLRHKDNDALRAKIADHRLTEAQLYRELLNLIYRLLFLMVAEERRLLFAPAADAAARNDVYLRWYGVGRLRERAEKRPGENGYGDLWEGLKETFRLFREEPAAAKLALSALNGELFGVTALPDLEDRDTRLGNDNLLDAIRQLSMFEERAGRRKAGVPRRVNYAGLDVEELGSIYESLLDYHPQVSRYPWSFALAAGSQRKETGSYYTPPELVRELIESALVPVMEERRDAAKTKEEKERALLSLTICDPAAGSGHFLLAAARRIGRELAIVHSGEAEPAPETYRTALRDVIRHCLYAVDKNPLAVDLCKVALWIEGHAPGLPLSFLDHRIRCGDSLVGVFDLDVLKAGIPDAAFKPLTGDDRAVCGELRKRNRREREAPLGVFWAETDLAALARRFAELAEMPDGTLDEVRRKTEAYRELIENNPISINLRHGCDAWTAAFFASRAAGQIRTAPTTADVWNGLAGRPDPQRAAIIETLIHRSRFFHWRLEFPEVFDRGGFDVMLGNPPWEVSQLSEAEYFSVAAPNIAALKGAARKSAIADLRQHNPVLWQTYREDLRATETNNEFAREAKRFPLTAVGKLNSYALFSELSMRHLGPHGRSGMIVQTGIVTDDNSKLFFDEVINKGQLASVFSFENEEFIFKSIHHSFRFCLLTLIGSGETKSQAEFVFFARQPSALNDKRRRFTLSADDIARINPNTKTAPIFRSRADAELTKKIYENVPVLLHEATQDDGDPWGVGSNIIQNFFSTSNEVDQLLFVYAEDIEANAKHLCPVVRGTMIDHFDHRAARYDRVSKRFVEVADSLRDDPIFDFSSDKYVPRAEVNARLSARGWRHDWLLGWRDITSAHVIRTVIASFLPASAADDTLSLILPTCATTELTAVLLGILNSLIFDYVARQKVGGTHLRKYILAQLPVFPPNAYKLDAVSFIVPRVLALSYTSEDLKPLAEELGYDGPPFRWDPDRRALLKAELDAYFAYLYGLSRDELRYILDPQDVMGADYPSETFRVLRENECKAFGEYRTRRLVLEAWDRFAEDGIFDPAELRDPTHFDAVQRALVETRGRVKSLERELQELLARSDETPLPTLFVEGESDVTILTAAWQALHPSERLPVTILAAAGTRQMESLAGRGAALRQLLGDRLVFALADNDREGRALVEDGRTRRGGVWRQQSNGIHWSLLAPTAEFEQAMKRFTIDATYWPFTIENAFRAALRRQAMAEGAYGIDEATVQPAFLEDAATSNKALRAAHQLEQTSDDAMLYFRPPDPSTKLAFAEWIAAPERRDRGTFAAFAPILDGLHAILSEWNPPLIDRATRRLSRGPARE